MTTKRFKTFFNFFLFNKINKWFIPIRSSSAILDQKRFFFKFCFNNENENFQSKLLIDENLNQERVRQISKEAAVHKKCANIIGLIKGHRREEEFILFVYNMQDQLLHDHMYF